MGWKKKQTYIDLGSTRALMGGSIADVNIQRRIMRVGRGPEAGNANVFMFSYKFSDKYRYLMFKNP